MIEDPLDGPDPGDETWHRPSDTIDPKAVLREPEGPLTSRQKARAELRKTRESWGL